MNCLPLQLPARTDIVVEASKSLLQRYLIIASMQESPCVIIGKSNCEDVQNLILNLSRFCLYTNETETGYLCESLKTKRKDIQLSISEGGTALRFLIARAACAINKRFTIEMGEYLKTRPIQPLLDSITALGGSVLSTINPLNIKGTALHGTSLSLDSQKSSQFASSLMLIAPAFVEGITIHLEKAVSFPYIQLTQDSMAKAGIFVELTKERIAIPAHQKYHIEKAYIEPDFSIASSFWTLGAMNQSPIGIQSHYRDSLQPDFHFLAILAQMGAKIEIKNNCITTKYGCLKGGFFSMKGIPDQVINLAILALFAETPTIITDIDNLQYKESNRILGIKESITELGGKAEYKKGTLYIEPLQSLPKKVNMKTYNDHRFSMAFRILQQALRDICVEETHSITKSSTIFEKELKGLEG